MMRLLVILFPCFLVTACGGSIEQPQSIPGLTEESIDKYVEEKLDTSQSYEIIQGLRFSRGETTYQAEQFSQQDTVVLCSEEIVGKDGNVMYRNFFFQHGLPVFVEEFEMVYYPEYIAYRQTKTYLNGAIILKAYERKANLEEDLANTPFKEITATMDQFDFQRPQDAVMQRGDFEMKFGEFLELGLESYLVLENEKSGYDVALYILKGDGLLDALYSDPASYEGRTIHVLHDFIPIGGVERVVYKGGYLVN